MVATYQQGLRVLAVSFLALGGCTYNENELRPVPHALPDAAPDLNVGGIDTPGIARLDAEALDVGTALDGAIDAPIDAPMLDTAIDSPTRDAIDGGGIDLPALDSVGADAGDVPITSVTIDGGIDVSPLDGGVTEAGRLDGAGGPG
jgi:hypothetical protein